MGKKAAGEKGRLALRREFLPVSQTPQSVGHLCGTWPPNTATLPCSSPLNAQTSFLLAIVQESRFDPRHPQPRLRHMQTVGAQCEDLSYTRDHAHVRSYG